MKLLVIGGDGRAHAIAWRLATDSSTNSVFCVPGNAGAVEDALCIPGNISKVGDMSAVADLFKVDCAVVGPSKAIFAGVVDEFRSKGISIVGPTAEAAQLGSSRVFAKEFMVRHGIPTPRFAVLERLDDIQEIVGRFGYPVVLKTDGPTGPNDIVIAVDGATARAEATRMLGGEEAREASNRIVVEENAEGEQLLFTVLSDGGSYCLFPPVRTQRHARDGSQGPRTAGMGAYCDDSILDSSDYGTILDLIVEPALSAMIRQGTPFTGFLVCELIMAPTGPKVLEFKVRLGDPETQALLYRLEAGFAELVVSAAKGSMDLSLVRTAAKSSACVVMASEGYPGSYSTGFVVEGIRRAEHRNVKVFHAGTKLSGGKPVTTGGRVVGVTARGKHLSSAVEHAYGAVESIRFKGSHYRLDIGSAGHDRP